MLSCNRKSVERRDVRRFTSCFDIQLRANAPNEFRCATFRGKHTGKKKKIAGLNRFDIGAEWFGGAGNLIPSSFNCAQRWPVDPFRELPFPTVRTTVDVQHLPGYLASFCKINDRTRYIIDRRTFPIGTAYDNLFRKVGVKRGVNDAWGYGVKANVLLCILQSETPYSCV